MTSSDLWDEESAKRYDDHSSTMFSSEVLEPTIGSAYRCTSAVSRSRASSLAGLELEARWGDWDRSPFTNDSQSHVSVWRKPG